MNGCEAQRYGGEGATKLLYGRLSDGNNNVRLVTAIRQATCQNDDDATINFGERRYVYYCCDPLRITGKPTLPADGALCRTDYPHRTYSGTQPVWLDVEWEKGRSATVNLPPASWTAPGAGSRRRCPLLLCERLSQVVVPHNG